MTVKKKIGVDLDDVVWSFNRHFIPYANKLFGTSVTYEAATHFDFETMYGVPNKEVLKHVERFCHDHRLHGGIPPVAGAQETLSVLSREYDTPAITSRCESIRTQTEELLYAHNFLMLREVHFTNSTTLRPNLPKRKKSEVCLELDVELFIDDALHNATDIASVGIPVILMDRPWNQGSIPEGVYRVGDYQLEDPGWQCVPALVRSILG